MRASPAAPHPALPGMLALPPGARITVVKLDPDGNEAARYPGQVIATLVPEPWLGVRATWTYREMVIDGLELQPGDELIEWFSPAQPFNAFAVHAPGGKLRGWYANVTYPAYLGAMEATPALYWHDLYLDLVGLPDGTFTLRDEDELAGSGLAEQDPSLHSAIKSAEGELVRRFQCGLPPFSVDNAQFSRRGAENDP